MFRLPLFRIRAFTFGTLSTFLSAVARGGLMFMLIIWLQGIWLPLHGVNFADTPLRAGIYMLPLTLGMLVAGPTSGYLSDRFGARWFATGGMLGTALSFVLLTLLPIDFSYPLFALVLLLDRRLDGHVRLAQPRGGDEQPAAAGPRRGWRHEPDLPELRAGALDRDLLHADDPRARLDPAAHARLGLQAHGISAAAASSASHMPPVSILFAAFLGYNPIEHLVGAHALASLSAANHATLDGRSFFPHLISGAVRSRAARGVRVRDRRMPDRGGAPR